MRNGALAIIQNPAAATSSTASPLAVALRLGASEDVLAAITMSAARASAPTFHRDPLAAVIDRVASELADLHRGTEGLQGFSEGDAAPEPAGQRAVGHSG